MPEGVSRSACRMCGSVCGIIVRSRGGRVIDVRGDTDNLLSKGYLCGKGRTLGASHHDPLRLDRSLLGRPSARTVASLDETLDDLTARLRRIIDESGVAAVGLYLGTSGFLESGSLGPVLRFASNLGTPSFYSPVTVDVVARFAAGLAVTDGAHAIMPVADYGRARLWLCLGHNPVVSHSFCTPNPMVTLRAVKDRGQVWVVDPRRSEVAQQATRHLQIRPGTDVFLLGHLLRELLADGADVEYLRDHATGVNDLRRAVDSHTAELTARRTGTPLEDLAVLVSAIRHVGTIAVTTGTGIRMGPYPAVAEWLSFALSIVTGSMDRAGGSLVLNRGIPYAVPSDGGARGPASRPELPVIGGHYPCAAMADEIESGHLRALISFGGNPITAIPDSQRLTKALGSIEVFAVNDIVPTSATELATHVLPGTSQLESDCIVRGVTADGGLFQQFSPAVFPAVHDRKPTWWYVDRLARGLQLREQSFTGDDAHGRDESSRELVDALRGSDNFMKVEGKVSFGSFVDELPSRRWNLAPPAYLEQLRLASEPPALVLIPRRQSRHVNSYLADVAGPSGKVDLPELLINPHDADEADIDDGALALVTSATGQLAVRATVTADIVAGAVSIPHGHHAANVNVLSSTATVDPISGMPILSGVAVAVRPL